MTGSVLGLGTDLVDVARFRLAMERQGDRLLDRLFSDAERAYGLRHRNPAPMLAARFGAKEAVMKAMGVGLWKFALRDVEVVKLPSGQPTVALHAKALAMRDERGVAVVAPDPHPHGHHGRRHRDRARRRRMNPS